MISDDFYLEVPQKVYNTNFTSRIGASTVVLMQGGGAYNMKVAGVWVEMKYGLSAIQGTPLYGEDWIYFGFFYRTQLNKVEGVLGTLRGRVIENIDSTASTNTTGAQAAMGLTASNLDTLKMKTKAAQIMVEQYVSV